MRKQIIDIVQMLLALTLFPANNFAAIGDVSARLDAYRAATLDNGLVRIVIASDGRVTSCNYDGQQIIPSGCRFYFSCNQPDYAELEADAAQIVTNTADMAEVVYTQTSPTGGIRWSQGYILRRGVSGFYTYLVAEGIGDNMLGEARMVYRLKDDLFNYGYVSSEMQGAMPSAAEMKRSEDRLVQDATFKLDDGTIYTKYNWANYVCDDHFHGLISDDNGIGAWSIPVSTEYINGGPMRQDLTVHATDQSPLILQMLHGNHFGPKAQKYAIGTKKIYGPFFFYLNKGTREDMIADAASQAAWQEAQWPFSWFHNDLYPVERSTVTGCIVQTGYADVPLQVVLAQPGEVYDQGDGYIFSAVTTTDGKFTISNVRPGAYTLTAYALGGGNAGQLTKDNIIVSEPETDLGTIRWEGQPYGSELWRIGESNRLSDGYKLSDANRSYSLFQESPANLTFTTGSSNEATDWYCAQTKVGTWNIKFDVDDPNHPFRLTAAAAGAANVTRMNVYVNGTEMANNTWTYQSDGSVYRSAVLSGRYQQHTLDLPAGTLKTGENTIALELTEHNYATSGIAGVMWDCIKLEVDERREAYGFTNRGTSDGTVPNWGTAASSADQTLQMLALGSETFGNRFACGPKRGDANVFKFRDSGDYHGLYSKFADRYLSILNLQQDDRVTITMNDDRKALAFSDTSIVWGAKSGDVVANGEVYIVSDDGNLNLKTTGETYITSITISHPRRIMGDATLVSSKALDFTGLPVKAYIATQVENGEVTFTRVEKVPASTPVFLKTETTAMIDIPVLEGDAESIATNLLRGSATETTSLQSDSNTKYYVFGTLNGVAGFYPVSTSKTLTSAAGKAYLQLTAAQAATRISMVFDETGETTAINTAEVNTMRVDNAWYSLQGVRVAHPTRGLYIRNGKKIIVK